MDPKNSSETLKHLDKQKELLADAHKKLSFELHRLQVEEEMLMRKFYELSTALGLNTKSEVRRWESSDVEDDDPDRNDLSLADASAQWPRYEGREACAAFCIRGYLVEEFDFCHHPNS
ncbi:hypothetical protein KSS87_017100 [Heliosperma pusillum]|nr:hypothetical protein KSS87_017100 [Heliosperma pusillum]